MKRETLSGGGKTVNILTERDVGVYLEGEAAGKVDENDIIANVELDHETAGRAE